MARLTGQLGLEVEGAFRLEQGGVDGQVHLIHRRGLVAVQELAEGALLFCAFAHFGDEDGLAPEIDQVYFAFGRVEQ